MIKTKWRYNWKLDRWDMLFKIEGINIETDHDRSIRLEANAKGWPIETTYGPSKVSSPEFKRAQTAKNRAARNLVENMDRSANTERIVWNTKYPELDAFVNGEVPGHD